MREGRDDFSDNTVARGPVIGNRKLRVGLDAKDVADSDGGTVNGGAAGAGGRFSAVIESDAGVIFDDLSTK